MDNRDSLDVLFGDLHKAKYAQCKFASDVDFVGGSVFYFFIVLPIPS